MTFNLVKKGALAALTSLVLGTAALTLPASAMANEGAVETTTPTEFQVVSTSNGLVRDGVKAYKKGDFEKSVALNKAVIRIRPSKRKIAVAQSNLCAGLAMLGNLEQAETACDEALRLRPGFEPAQSNKTLLAIKLAQK